MKKTVFMGVMMAIGILGFGFMRAKETKRVNNLAGQAVIYVKQIGKIVGDCEKGTGKSSKYCSCANNEALKAIQEKLNDLIQSNRIQSVKIQLVDDGVHQSQYLLGDFVKTPFPDFCAGRPLASFEK